MVGHRHDEKGLRQGEVSHAGLPCRAARGARALPHGVRHGAGCPGGPDRLPAYGLVRVLKYAIAGPSLTARVAGQSDISTPACRGLWVCGQAACLWATGGKRQYRFPPVVHRPKSGEPVGLSIYPHASHRSPLGPQTVLRGGESIGTIDSSPLSTASAGQCWQRITAYGCGIVWHKRFHSRMRTPQGSRFPR